MGVFMTAYFLYPAYPTWKLEVQSSTEPRECQNLYVDFSIYINSSYIRQIVSTHTLNQNEELCYFFLYVSSYPVVERLLNTFKCQIK